MARPDRVQPGDTPMANLHVTLLDKLGIPTETFGDSNAGVEYLSAL